MDILYMVMPAYNEEDAIGEVIEEWYPVVERHHGNGKSRMVVIDDGSRDNTVAILRKKAENRPLLEVMTKENSGHGDTLLYGYRYALGGGAEYVFQTDSDGQTRPEEFEAFWERRKEYDAIIGHRSHREDGIARVFVTKVLQLVVLLCLGVWVTDANTPFRLMHRKYLKRYLELVPQHFNLPNIVLSAAYTRFRKARTLFIPITFRKRQGGVNSINLRRISQIGRKAIGDFRQIKRRMDAYENAK